MRSVGNPLAFCCQTVVKSQLVRGAVAAELNAVSFATGVPTWVHVPVAFVHVALLAYALPLVVTVPF